MNHCEFVHFPSFSTVELHFGAASIQEGLLFKRGFYSRGAYNSENTVPVFDPDKSDISPKAWVNLVDLGRQAAGKDANGVDIWDDSVTASHSILSLRGKSADWVANLLEEKDGSVKKWSELKKKFLARFSQKHTLSEKTRLISDLQMTSTENCQDFFDRCKTSLNILYDEMWEPAEEANAVADKLARTVTSQTPIQCRFKKRHQTRCHYPGFCDIGRYQNGCYAS